MAGRAAVLTVFVVVAHSVAIADARPPRRRLVDDRPDGARELRRAEGKRGGKNSGNDRDERGSDGSGAFRAPAPVTPRYAPDVCLILHRRTGRASRGSASGRASCLQ